MEATSIGHPNPILDAGSWHLLTPPAEKDEKIQVGVVDFHPSLNRVAYSTRARNDQSQDIGKTKIVIHDFDQNSSGTIVALFSLRELNKRIDEFRTKSHLSMMAASAHSTHSQEMLHSLCTTSPSTMPYTAQMLGAVQNISFLSREAIRCQVPPGYVREEPSRMQRLIIGFRRCVVVVSAFHLKDQKKESCARGVQVVAYIGPDDMDEYERNEKARKRQPSSFPIPISENILAYGCYDGGIRFYDIIRRKQAKSALGPNGRGNPIVRVINANRTQSHNLSSLEVKNRRTVSCQTILPRIISVCATGVAYLWELDLSIDLDNGEVLSFDIPPPLASFDGLVAAVSWKGLPVKYPPNLSPTSIAALSPCSSWEQTDEVNAQFKLSFDPRQNVLCWVFSPDCIGSSLKPHATREERLNMNGALVCWELTHLPRPEWPPPILPPHCVVQLHRTEGGRVSSEMVIPGISGVLSNTHLATVSITSSNELVASVTYLKNPGESVQLESSVMTIADLKTLDYGQSGYVCSTIATSHINPSLIAIGTQYGILFANIISGLNDTRKQLFPIEEEPVNQNDNPSIVPCLSDCSSGKASLSTQQQQILQLESRNKELECQLDDLKNEARNMFTEDERNELHSRVKGFLEQKNESCQSLQAEVEMLRVNVGCINRKLKQEQRINQETALKLAAIEENCRELDKEANARDDLMKAAQDESDNLRQQLDEVNNKLEEVAISETDSRLTLEDYKLGTDSKRGYLESTAKKSEASLRNYIALLEEDKAVQDKELEDARRQAEKYAKKYDTLTVNLRADVKEQKLAIDSLVDLLERQRQNHTKEMVEQNDEIGLLKKQLVDLQVEHQKELDKMICVKAENAVMKADASTRIEIFLAMEVELQNALNELAEYQHGKS
mmetsp:Transcript_15052/g.32642  ORF Transcript_15052/g.32642 Transcript_15052/m.32642 type:complete len:898 (-) Transcript_15052:175-2868(-)|eukprot:CAMPEP_0172318570 /NCGR_PEP_ID=MMETSP1058-20130122/35243_1 /TAXON_ID=83371 /ORGANISM="Detonula confervacea, Strain CCMP 353" /LENGTH=897 /DNA_ID=CAMNT_0013033427 /DNA_START=63 /DNA_END=2756 /DNA_ORIENTATION=+